MLFPEFIDKYLLTMTFKETEVKSGEDWVKGVTAYKIKIKSPGFDKSLKTRFMIGPAHSEPDLENVLCCVKYDAQSADSCSDKWEFIREYGYQTCPEKGEQIWFACQEQKQKLINYFGQIIADELLECEE